MPNPDLPLRIALINEETEHQIEGQSFMLLLRTDKTITTVAQISGKPEVMAMFISLTRLWSQMAMDICQSENDMISGVTIAALIDVLRKSSWFGHPISAWHV